jgi:hypothetical protein
LTRCARVDPGSRFAAGENAFEQPQGAEIPDEMIYVDSRTWGVNSYYRVHDMAFDNTRAFGFGKIGHVG